MNDAMKGRPLTGARIETVRRSIEAKGGARRPLTGARIETGCGSVGLSGVSMSPPHGGADRNIY